MRRLILIAISSLLLILPAAGQEEARSSNVLTQYLDRANIHPPVNLGRLTIYPIVLSSERELTDVLTMDQALSRRLLVIEELDSATVEKARFVNKSRSQMIFLMAGEVITGGKQNRTLTTDALLGPDSSAVLPLYCVQKGRWTGEKDFSGGTTVAPQAIRSRAAQGAGQREVWSEVARANRRLGAETESEDLAAAMATPENRRRIKEIRDRVVPKLPAGTAGVVLADGGSIVAADLFNSAELFEAMREKVFASYFSQHEPREANLEKIARPSQTDVREYLQSCYRARLSSEGARGVGEVFAISGRRTGRLLAYEPPVRIRREERILPRRPGMALMVHTALMEEVVPVRPEPEPRPIPVPMPRPMPRLPMPEPDPRE